MFPKCPNGVSSKRGRTGGTLVADKSFFVTVAFRTAAGYRQSHTPFTFIGFKPGLTSNLTARSRTGQDRDPVRHLADRLPAICRPIAARLLASSDSGLVGHPFGRFLLFQTMDSICGSLDQGKLSKVPENSFTIKASLPRAFSRFCSMHSFPFRHFISNHSRM